MTDNTKNILLFVIIFFAIGLVGGMDFQDEQEQERAYECMRTTRSWSCETDAYEQSIYDAQTVVHEEFIAHSFENMGESFDKAQKQALLSQRDYQLR